MTRTADEVLKDLVGSVGLTTQKVETGNLHVKDGITACETKRQEAQKALYTDLMAIVGEDDIGIPDTPSAETARKRNNLRMEIKYRLAQYFGQEDA